LAAQAVIIERLTRRVDILEVKHMGLKSEVHIACRTIGNHLEETEEGEEKVRERK
jgi:hypothetical protein